ncbi:hypothetical protein NN561_009443 [Cricetulus griseus]
MAARRVFLADGSEAFKPEDIPHEANVYISTGEPFLDPFKKLKATVIRLKKVHKKVQGKDVNILIGTVDEMFMILIKFKLKTYFK